MEDLINKYLTNNFSIENEIIVSKENKSKIYSDDLIRELYTIFGVNDEPTLIEYIRKWIIGNCWFNFDIEKYIKDMNPRIWLTFSGMSYNSYVMDPYLNFSVKTNDNNNWLNIDYQPKLGLGSTLHDSVFNSLTESLRSYFALKEHEKNKISDNKFG